MACVENHQSGQDATGPALRGRAAAARLYLCTDARQRQGDLAGFLDQVLGSGVDIVQLREKGLEAGEELAAARGLPAGL